MTQCFGASSHNDARDAASGAAVQSGQKRIKTSLILIAVLWSVVGVPAATAGDSLFVVNKSGDSLSIIDLASGSESSRLKTGAGPHEVEVSEDETLAVVSNYGTEDAPGSTLTRIDLQTLKATSIDLGEHTKPHGLAWHPDGRHVLVTTEGSQSVTYVDVVEARVVGNIRTPGIKPHMVVLDSSGRSAWVTQIESGTVSKIDLEARSVVATAEAGEGAEGIALSSTGSLWTAANGDGTVRVFEAETLEPKARIDVGGMSIRVEIAEDSGLALITAATSGLVVAVDLQTFEIVGEAQTRGYWDFGNGRFLGGLFGWLPVPVGAQLSAKRDSFFVANSFGGVVVEYSLSDFKALRVLEAGPEPDGMAITSSPPSVARPSRIRGPGKTGT